MSHCPALTINYLIRRKKISSDKQSSLFCPSANDEKVLQHRHLLSFVCAESLIISLWLNA
jgi:hypothetical protein